MIDPLVAAVCFGVLGPFLAGPLVASGLDALPSRWRRTAAWTAITAALAYAIAAAVLQEVSGTSPTLIYVLVALPGLLTFLVWRSQLATALVCLMPMYFVIAIVTRGRRTYAPEMALDRAIQVEPAWMLVYGSLYVFALVLPLLVVRDWPLVQRAMKAYLLVMLLSYLGFLLYPTAAPRTDEVTGPGFAAWTLQIAYSLDPPYNCFPSLHVAYSFVSALTCYRVHRGLGVAAAVWASLIGVSTLYTKQHYVVDVVVGTAAGLAAYFLFLRSYPRAAVAESHRARAPVRALIAAGSFGVMVIAFWIVYWTSRAA